MDGILWQTQILWFIQLREKIIPAFERKHPKEQYQALFLIDNSQGHAAYAQDALIASRMNLKPGGKQALMRNGWYMHNNLKISQSMVYESDHPEFPGLQKGMRDILKEWGLWRSHLLMQCKDGVHDETTPDSCCALRILENQPDFKEQRSLVQEVIKEAGHLCIFLPKYHCELNFIEHFWGNASCTQVSRDPDDSEMGAPHISLDGGLSERAEQ